MQQRPFSVVLEQPDQQSKDNQQLRQIHSETKLLSLSKTRSCREKLRLKLRAVTKQVCKLFLQPWNIVPKTTGLIICKANLLNQQLSLTLHLDLSSYTGNFIGYLFADDKNMSVELVKEGLAKMHFTAERGKYFDHLSRFVEP